MTTYGFFFYLSIVLLGSAFLIWRYRKASDFFKYNLREFAGELAVFVTGIVTGTAIVALISGAFV